MKTALIFGVTGQDGSYLSEYLLSKGYVVHGTVRRSSSFNTWRIDHLLNHNNFFTHYCDLTDSTSVLSTIDRVRPNEIYNLAAQSHVGVSFTMPEYTFNVDALGVVRVLEAARSIVPSCRLYQASTSELFGGKRDNSPQSEATPFYPKSPYGCAKISGFWSVVNYREAHSLFAVNGILFNHESPRRGENFVTRKIAMGVANIIKGHSQVLSLGNLDACRDWGHAKDYVRAMYLMLQTNSPRDYVIGTGNTRSVREFVQKAFSYVGVEIEWVGRGVDEKGVCVKTGLTCVQVDPSYFRPAEVEYLLADPTLAKNELGWSPEINFDQLVDEMVEAELRK